MVLNIMETLRKSSYLIPIKLENEEGKYMLIHGYTGAMDVVSERVVLYLKNNDISKLSDSTLQALHKRGYITNKTKEEEIEYVERIAKALHKRDNILHKSFTWVVTYNCNFRCPYCFEKREYKDSSHHIALTKSQVDQLFNAMIEIEPRKQLQDSVITLYGGEPLLKGNKEIVTYIVHEGRKRGYKFHAITNGYDLDSYFTLLAPDLITLIQITIDGTKKNHNQKRKHFEDSNSFDKIISNIKLIFEKELNVDIHVRVNVDNYNLEDFKSLYLYFREIGFLSHKNFKMYSALIQDNKEVKDSDKKDIDFLSESEYLAINEKMGTITSCAGYDAIYKKIEYAITTKKPLPLTAVHCTAQTGEYVFSPLNEIYPCWEVVGDKKFQIGTIENNAINWNKNELKKWHSHDVASLSCKYCKYVFLCGGGCLAMKNNQCNLFKRMIIKAVNTIYNSIHANMFNKLN